MKIIRFGASPHFFSDSVGIKSILALMWNQCFTSYSTNTNNFDENVEIQLIGGELRTRTIITISSATFFQYQSVPITPVAPLTLLRFVKDDWEAINIYLTKVSVMTWGKTGFWG